MRDSRAYPASVDTSWVCSTPIFRERYTLTGDREQITDDGKHEEMSGIIWHPWPKKVEAVAASTEASQIAMHCM